MNCVLFTHIDLDGYSSSILIQKLFKNILVKYVNYGFDKESYNLELMKNSDVIIFTDISVSKDTAIWLNSFEDKKKILIDHHKSAYDELSELKYDWIDIDLSMSGALLVYDRYKNFDSIKPYKEFAELVSDYDLWHHDYEKSKLLQFLWSQDKDYFLSRFLVNPNVNFTADENLIIEKSLKDYEYSYTLAKSSLSTYTDCENMKFGLISNIGNLASLVCDKILKENLDIDYLVVISNYGLKLSLRSLRVNVREIAEKFGGGGHDLSSGCSYSEGTDIVESLKKREIIRFIDKIRI